MVTVRVEAQGAGWVCQVAVEHGGERSRHTVTVTPGDLARWGTDAGPQAVQDLVERSFAFLLERESPGAILSRFGLATIQRYFPEYDQQFKR
jgi:hypothetical protein